MKLEFTHSLNENQELAALDRLDRALNSMEELTRQMQTIVDILSFIKKHSRKIVFGFCLLSFTFGFVLGRVI